ncbi:type II secretion system F family protein [Halorhodospira halophila]|uniref:General secretion pathway protein F n=1 Tax=Halorhodospira halophila (strain DSM 244 / SL1) TaxID=349124 RepID=A1WYM3_HALHL|nr:type II secretion system F family protein [Halorhodospira halophila]ABM62785.1 type II secretion system protein [Halorhodospira halophila SL1]
MARLSWRGLDAGGRRLSGTCHADSPSAVHHALAEQGVAVTAVRRELWRPRRRQPGSARRAAILRRLASVLEAGAPLSEALRVTAAQAPDAALRNGLRGVRYAVERGTDLATAFGTEFPGLRPAHRALLAAGTWTGDLPAALGSVAAEIEREAAIVAQLRRALTYPAVVAGAALTLIALLLTAVVPRFAGLFEQSGEPLPAPTRAVLAASEGFAVVAPATLLLGLVTGIGLTAALRRRPAWRRHAAAGLARMPWLGTLLLEAALSRWSATLARLHGAGVPLLDALPRAAEAARGADLEPRLAHLGQRIGAGESLAEALRKSLPESREISQLVAIGERSGRLEELLHEAATLHQQRLEARLQRAGALLEPALILLLGAITAGVVAALYLPVFRMGATL